MTPSWPGGATGAVSLTFDDGSPSQLQTAYPLLEKYGLKGTFYLCPRGDDWRQKLTPWKEVARAGHEVGNHTTRHICSRQMNGQPPGPGNLEGQTLEGIEKDILLAEERLTDLFGSGPRTFCYPCYQNHVGEGPGRRSYVPVVAKHFVAGRGTGEFGSNHPASCDLHYLWSWRCEGLQAPEMIGRAEECSAQGTWDVFVFHTIDQGRLSVTSVQFEQFLAHLARHRDRIWVAPVLEVARHVVAERSQDAGAARAAQ